MLIVAKKKPRCPKVFATRLFYVRMCLSAWLKLDVGVLDGECYVQVVPSTDVVVAYVVVFLVACTFPTAYYVSNTAAVVDLYGDFCAVGVFQEGTCNVFWRARYLSVVAEVEAHFLLLLRICVAVGGEDDSHVVDPLA